MLYSSQEMEGVKNVEILLIFSTISPCLMSILAQI